MRKTLNISWKNKKQEKRMIWKQKNIEDQIKKRKVETEIKYEKWESK